MAVKSARTIDTATATSAIQNLGAVFSLTFDNSTTLSLRGAIGNDGVRIVRPGLLGTGGSADFNGVSGLVAVTDNDDLAPSSSYSVSGWFEADRLKATQTIWSYNAKGSDHGLEFQMALKGNRVVLTLEGESGTTVLRSAKGAVTVDTPHHVAMTIDGKVAKLYVDGTEVSRGVLPSTEGVGDLPLVIGASNAKSLADTVNKPGAFFDGEIDDVGVFDRTLSASEIQRLAGVTSGGGDDAIDILIIGDSLTVDNSPFIGGGNSYGSLLESYLQARGYNVDIKSISVQGYTIEQGLGQASNYFNNGGEVPDAAIVALGTNDRFQNVSVSDSEAAMQSLLDLLDSRGIEPVLVAGAYGSLSRLSDPSSTPTSDERAFEAMFGRQASQHDAILYKYLLEEVAGKTSTLTVDSLHPNEAGTNLIIQDMASDIIKLLTEAS